MTAIADETESPGAQGLGEDGLRVWTAAHRHRTFSDEERVLLRAGCELLDLARQAREAVRRDGVTTLSRYHGQRTTPAARQAVRFSQEARSILRRLGVVAV